MGEVSGTPGSGGREEPEGRKDLESLGEPDGAAARDEEARQDASHPPDAEILARSLAYAEALHAPEDATLRWVLEASERRGLPAIQISSLEGRLLALLAAIVGARRLLEVGTLGGYSSLWLLSLLPPGARLVTLEREPAHAAVAREAFARAGVAGRVDLRVVDARREMRRLAKAGGEPFDLVFVDADKEGYPVYLEAAARLLRPGGLLLADNTLWKGKVALPAGEDEDAPTRAIRTFNGRLAADERFQATIVPIRDGLTVARRV